MIIHTLRRLLIHPGSRRRLVLWNLLIVLAVWLCFGLFITQQTHSELTHWQQEELSHLELVANDFRIRLAPLLADVRILASSRRAVEYLQQPSAETRAALTARLRAAAEHRTLYSQLRLLDQHGQELARVDHRGGLIQVVPQDALQNKADRYYVEAGQRLQPGEVYLSPLDLNIESGQIEYPLNPTLRAVSPVFLQGELRGMVVINYLASALLESFAANMVDARGETMLLDRDGYWLHAPDPRQRFGFQLDHGLSFAATYPQIWASLEGQRRGEVQGDAGWFGFSRLELGEGE